MILSSTRTITRLALLVAASLCAANLSAQESHPIYRLQPTADDQLAEVAPADVEPGGIYKYYNEQLGQEVWGVATKEGGFRYAMGEGSVQSVNRFKIRFTPEQEAQILDSIAPGLKRYLESTGRGASVRLEANGRWQLIHTSSIAKVYDQLTMRRWEWHGQRRVAVRHTAGYEWVIIDGEYRPAVFAPACSVCAAP